MFARILKLCEMSWPALTNLKAWSKRSASFSAFGFDNFSSPTLRIAQATNEQGEALVFCPIEQVFMVRSFAVNPKATEAEARRAGDIIDQEIAHQAQRAGITKLLLVVPHNYPNLPDEKFELVKIFVRKVQPAIAMQGVGCHAQSPTQYLN